MKPNVKTDSSIHSSKGIHDVAGANKKQKIMTGATLKREDDYNDNGVLSSSSRGRSIIASVPLRDRFLALFAEPQYQSGISNAALKEHFKDGEYLNLVPIINELTRDAKLIMSKEAGSKELFYSLVSDEIAVKFQGLDASARMVYQVIEKAGNMGCWTKDIRVQTNVQQNMLTKILKSLESRRLVKPVKSVTAKSKKLYMLYDLTPSKQLTGGVWYSDLEFDHEFISKMRSFLLFSIRKLNQGKGVTMSELHNLMIQKKVSNVELDIDEVRQLLQTMVFDYLVEELPSSQDDSLFVAARRVTVPCEYSWWDALESDFMYRTIKFEDGVVLAPHEPHYHTA